MSTDGIAQDGCVAHNFTEDEIDRVDYYLTHPVPEHNHVVRLAVKLKLKNGESYGNIIAIPFDKLKELVTSADLEYST